MDSGIELDTRTLIVACVLGATLMGSVSLVYARVNGAARVIGDWGGAVLVMALGLAGLALRGMIPEPVSIALSPTIVVAGLVLAIRGLRAFCGTAPQTLFAWSMTAVLFALMLLFTVAWPNFTARTVIISTAIVVIALSGALLLRRHALPGCEFSFRFTEYVFWAVAAMSGARGLFSLFDGTPDILVPGAFNTATFLFYGGFICLTTLGVMWMEIEFLQKDLQRLARYDSLTGLLNRGTFIAEFEREASRAQRAARALSLVLLDLDHFKMVNDRHGHPAGDQVLRSFADVLRASVRKHDMLGRYGGEEFVVLMPETAKDVAVQVAARIRESIEEITFELAGQRVGVTVSGGVATHGVDGEGWDELLAAADAALYAAKNAGRNRIAMAGPAHGGPAP